MADALQLLRFVVNLSNEIVPCECETLCTGISRRDCEYRNITAFAAALIVERASGCNHNFDCNCTPEIADALAILRFIVNLTTKELDDIWRVE